MTRERTSLVAKWGVGVIVAIAIVALLIWVPKIQIFGWRSLGLHWHKPISHLDFTDLDRARQTLATILGGMAVLAGAFLTLRNVRAAERNADIAQKNLKIAGDKQITDRFTAAVNNLATAGDDKLAVRLGGIYALERIARDSTEDHWTVMEVLTAYVRANCPRNRAEEQQRVECDADGKLTPQAQQLARKMLPTDIQAILTVIGRRNVEYDQRRRLDLRHIDLYHANLALANLTGVVLTGSSLDSAYLEGAILNDAILKQTTLKGAEMKGAEMKGADLWKAILWHTDLEGANLTGAKMAGVELKGATLRNALLGDAQFLSQEALNTAWSGFEPASLPPGLHLPVEPTQEPPMEPASESPPTP